MGYRPQIYLLELVSLEVQRLSQGEHQDLQPDWAPNSSSIVFITTRNGPYQIWTMGLDGSEPTRFSASKDLKNASPEFSHDGSMIVYTQTEQGGVPWLMGARYPDGGVAEFRVYPFSVGVPMKETSYSPDGFWLAFESWPEGPQHDIWIMRSNGGDLAQLTFEDSWEFDAAWRPMGP
jgi:Tol biopolymer transport system component